MSRELWALVDELINNMVTDAFLNTFLIVTVTPFSLNICLNTLHIAKKRPKTTKKAAEIDCRNVIFADTLEETETHRREYM